MKHKSLIVASVLIAVLASACGQAAPSVSSATPATLTPMSTRVSIAFAVSPTAIASLTDTPTATATPAPTITPSGPFPVGIYVPKGNLTHGNQIEFRSDGTFTRTIPWEGVTIKGTYVVSHDQITFNDDTCTGFPGTYLWTFDGQMLTLEKVEDKCDLPRPADLQRKWIRQP